jgi:hypothetical protein
LSILSGNETQLRARADIGFHSPKTSVLESADVGRPLEFISGILENMLDNLAWG